MMRNLSSPRALSTALLLTLVPAALRAQAGASAATVLELPASARAMALGDAYAALGGDEASLFYNPAGLAAAERTSAALSVQRHVAASTLAAAALAARLGPGTLGVGVQVLDYGSEPEIVPDPEFGGERGIETGGDVTAQDLVLSAGYAVGLGELGLGGGTSVGVAAKYVRQQLAGESGGAAAFDVGVVQQLARGLSLGASLQNVGGRLSVAGSSAPLPRVLRFGGALQLPSAGSVSLLATAEGIKPRVGGVLPAGGLEAAWRSSNGLQLLGRVGGVARGGQESAGSALAFGAGLAASRLSLDYAYRGYDVVGGGVHRIGVRWRR